MNIRTVNSEKWGSVKRVSRGAVVDYVITLAFARRSQRKINVFFRVAAGVALINENYISTHANYVRLPKAKKCTKD